MFEYVISVLNYKKRTIIEALNNTGEYTFNPPDKEAKKYCRENLKELQQAIKLLEKDGGE